MQKRCLSWLFYCTNLCRDGEMEINMEIRGFFQEYPDVAIAFSGGVDSAYLLYEAKRYGRRVKAYFVKSQFQPLFELEDATRLAEELNADLEIIPFDVLMDKKVCENPENRCYFCKQKIFGALQARAAADGFNILIDGTNASDSAEGRPGMKALKEMNVLSPLRLCGITKDQVRARSREAGIFTWDKPSYACLAPRVPTGVEITADVLAKVERAEDALFDLGFTDFRVRIFNGGARIQLPEGQLYMALEKRREIIEHLHRDFKEILLDMEAR